MDIGLWVHRQKKQHLRRKLQRMYVDLQGSTWRPPVAPPAINFNQFLTDSIEEYRETYYAQARDKELPFLSRIGELGPMSVTLDFGCGLGRLASAFFGAGSSLGTYLGWEPEARARGWLQDAYAGETGFSFGGSNLPSHLNYVTHPEASKATTPQSGAVPNRQEWDHFLGGRRADLTWSHSVFTHMWPADAVNNLRLLKESSHSGALMVHTWLILDTHAESQVGQGLADRNLPFEIGGIRTLSRSNPLECTAYPLSLASEVYRDAGLQIDSIRFGSWTGRDNGVTYQDIVISRVP